MNNYSSELVFSVNKTFLLIVGGLSCTLFLVLAVWIQSGAANPLETGWLWTVHSIHSPWLDSLTSIMAYLGSMVGVLAITAVLVSACLLHKKLALAYLMVSGVLGIFILGWLCKFVFVRPRPEVWEQLVPFYGWSFPSNHSAYAVVLAGLISLLAYQTVWQKPVTAVAIIWCGLMGLSRIYLGAHFPSDVLAGWSLGIAWLCLLLWIFTHLQIFKHRAGTRAGNHEVK